MELDPVAELTVRDMISDLGLIVVGWYHSHPKFQPDPSVTDINNQQQYQNLMKDEISGIEPFVGLIVSTYDLKLTSLKSHHQWFHTKLYSDGTRGKKPFFIPMLLKTTEGIFCDRYHDIDAFSNDTQTKKLIKKLLELDPESTIIKNENEVNLSPSGSYEAKIKRKFYVDKKGNNSDDYMTDVRYSSVSNNKLNYGREGLQKNMKEEKGKRNYRKINGNDDVCSVKNDKTNNKNTYYSDDYNSDNNNDNHDANSDSHNDDSNTNNNDYHDDNSDSHNDGSNTNNNDYHDANSDSHNDGSNTNNNDYHYDNSDSHNDGSNTNNNDYHDDDNSDSHNDGSNTNNNDYHYDDNSDSHNDGSNTNNNYYPYDDNYDIEEENISEPLIFKISKINKKNIINNEIEQMWIMGGTQVKEDEVDVERSIQEEEGGGKEEDEEEKKKENEGRDEEINKDKEEIRNEEINLESINPLEHDFGGDNCQYIFGIKVPCSSKTSSMSIQSTREKVPMNFKAAGSSGYLGDDMIWPDPEGGRSDINHIDNNNNVNNGNDNDINHSKEINDINTLGNIDMIHHDGNDNNNKTESTSDVQGRRKYKKRINDDTYVERRSGREIKSRDLYVPEKEKILNPSVAATSTSTSVLTDKKVAETSIGSKSPSIVPINNSLNWNSKMKVNNVKMKLLDDDDNDQKQPLGRKKQKISGMIINPISHPISSKADKGNKFNNSYETISSSRSNNSSNLVSKMKHNGTVDKWLTAGSVAVAVKEHGSESSKNKSSKKNKLEPVKRNLKKILSDDFSSQSESNSFSSLFPPCNESNNNLPIKIDKRSKEYKLLVVKNLKFLKKSTNVSSMTDTAETVPSQLTKSNEREFLKNRKKGILSNIRVGTYSSDTEKEYFQDDNIEKKIEKEEEKEITESNTFLSLLQKLQSSNSSSIKGRELICSIKPNFRFLLLGIVSLGFYYANHPRRIDLNKVWKHDIIRSEKLKGSIRVWACKLYMSDSSTEKLISDIIDFLLSCWLDNDEEELKKPKNEIKKKKRKATTCSHGDNNCTSIHSHSHHIPLKQKFMIYKEDRGEIKVTKKKKKKKVLKKI